MGLGHANAPDVALTPPRIRSVSPYDHRVRTTCGLEDAFGAEIGDHTCAKTRRKDRLRTLVPIVLRCR